MNDSLNFRQPPTFHGVFAEYEEKQTSDAKIRKYFQLNINRLIYNTGGNIRMYLHMHPSVK